MGDDDICSPKRSFWLLWEEWIRGRINRNGETRSENFAIIQSRGNGNMDKNGGSEQKGTEL